MPQRGLRTLKNLDLRFCDGVGEAYCDFDRLLDFLCTLMLQNLYLHNCRVNIELFRMSFRGQRRFELLETLCLDAFEPENSRSDLEFVEFAARCGCFPKLRILKVLGKDNPNNELESIAHSCRASLRTLEIEVRDFSVKTDLDALLGVRIAERVEVELSFCCFSENEPWRVEVLEKLHCLVSITEIGRHVSNIDMLAAFPKLRAVKFEYCLIRIDEKDKLLKDPGHLKEITFYCCSLIDENSVKKSSNAYEQYSFKWERLSE